MKYLNKIIIFLFATCTLAVILSGSISAQSIMPSNNNTALQVVNDNGAKMNDSSDNTYTFFPGTGSGGLNAVKITDDSSKPSTGKVINTDSQSGTFYTAYTGGKGYADDGILMIAVNGTIPDNFQVNIKASGYQWTPSGGIPTTYTYNSTTLDETFYKSDFIYGPQTWKPYYTPYYPLFEKQDTTNTANTFNIMLIDLYAGMLNSNTLIDSGTIKIEYTFQNLPLGSLATFNIFAFTNAPGNQPVGVGWTNAVNNITGTSITTSGYYVNGNSPENIPPVDNVAPIASANPTGGLFNTIKTVTLSINEPGIIYYTINGLNPTISSTKYTSPISIISTKTLKYLAVDLAGNKSPIYTQIYLIDKVKPKVSTTNPANKSKKVSLTSSIKIHFNKNIFAGINYTKIYIKNLNSGKIVKITKKLSGNTLIIKMKKNRLHNKIYRVYLPSGAIKDKAGNKIARYTFSFRTK